MKPSIFGAGLLATACLLAPQQAQALSVTTNYLPFKIYQNAVNNVGPTGNFANFSSFSIGGGTLSGVGFKIAGASNGTGTATVAGNPFVANGTLATPLPATVEWAPNFTFDALFSGTSSLMPTATLGSITPVPCIAIQGCPLLGGNSIPGSANRYLELAGTTYSGTASPINVSGLAVTNFTNGTITSSTASANFSGTGTDLAYGFDPTPITGVVEKPYIEGWVALVYDYNVTPTNVPGPLPLMGAAAAFGWSRRLKKRISSAA